MITKTVLSHLIVSTVILTICPYSILIPFLSYLLYNSSVTHNGVLYLQDRVLTYCNLDKPQIQEKTRRNSMELWLTNNYHILQNLVSQNTSETSSV